MQAGQKDRAGGVQGRQAQGPLGLQSAGPGFHGWERDTMHARVLSLHSSTSSPESLGVLPLFRHRRGQLWTKTPEIRKVLPPPPPCRPPAPRPVFEMSWMGV